MALTMTRTRTQTTLTKLGELLSNVKGELEYVEVLITAAPEAREGLVARQRMLQGQHDALCTTLRQFDKGIDPKQVVAGADWQKAYRVRTPGSLARRYLAVLQCAPGRPEQSAPVDSQVSSFGGSLYAKQDVPATTLTQPSSTP
jgi:hypothetical protein